MADIDLRKAINAVSDIVQNRPLPLREFDQIYMKTGDMLLQASFVAEKFKDRSIVFIGDGDSIGLTSVYLHYRGVLEHGPSKVTVLDFDERIVNSILRFADRERLTDRIDAQLYNCIDSLPTGIVGKFDAFYSNPPWGASNDGESVLVFMERGIEAVNSGGEGLMVLADDAELAWPGKVLATAQRKAAELGFFVQEMMTQVHLYHLDDAPDLKSCNLLLRRIPGVKGSVTSYPLDRDRLENFYGRNNPLRVRYVRETKRLEYGRAPDNTYRFDELG